MYIYCHRLSVDLSLIQMGDFGREKKKEILHEPSPLSCSVSLKTPSLNGPTSGSEARSGVSTRGPRLVLVLRVFKRASRVSVKGAGKILTLVQAAGSVTEMQHAPIKFLRARGHPAHVVVRLSAGGCIDLVRRQRVVLHGLFLCSFFFFYFFG